MIWPWPPHRKSLHFSYRFLYVLLAQAPYHLATFPPAVLTAWNTLCPLNNVCLLASFPCNNLWPFNLKWCPLSLSIHHPILFYYFYHLSWPGITFIWVVFNLEQFCLLGTFGNVWRCFGLSQLESGVLQHLVGRGQGCCETSYNAQDSPQNKDSSGFKCQQCPFLVFLWFSNFQKNVVVSLSSDVRGLFLVFDYFTVVL